MRVTPALFILSLLAASASAAPIGRVLVAVGDVSVQRNGQTLPLKARAEIELGDLIKTGPASNAQIRLTDGSIIAIKPVTEFKFDDYQFTGKQDGSEKGAFSLIKGGFRTITGAIGRQHPQNYKVSTPMASIGIRGTFYNLAICDSGCFNPDGSKARDGLYGGVVDGKIAVSNQTGEKTFGNDEFFHVASANEPPQGLIAPPAFLQDKLEGQKQSKKDKEKGEAAAAKPGEAKPEEKAAKAEDGGSGFKGDSRTEVVTETNTAQTEPVLAAAIDDYKAADDANATGGGSGIQGNRKSLMVHAYGDGTNDKLTEFHGITEYFIDTSIPKVSGVVTGDGDKVTAEASLVDFDSNSGDSTGVDLFWGRWTNGTVTVYNADGKVETENLGSGQSIHFIGGSQPIQLAPGTVNYSWIGGTTATFSDGDGSATVTSGSATINFGQAKVTNVTVTLDVTRGGYTNVPYTLNTGTSNIPLNISNGTIASFSGSGEWTTSAHTNNAYVLNCASGPSGCVTDIAGFVSGPNGEYLGLGYGIRGGLTDANGNQLQLSGVAAFHDNNP